MRSLKPRFSHISGPSSASFSNSSLFGALSMREARKTRSTPDKLQLRWQIHRLGVVNVGVSDMNIGRNKVFAISYCTLNNNKIITKRINGHYDQSCSYSVGTSFLSRFTSRAFEMNLKIFSCTLCQSLLYGLV